MPCEPLGDESQAVAIMEGTLAFRDYLRRDSATAVEYAALNRLLAKQYEFDREAYTEAKGPFIQRILKLAS